MSSTPPQIKAQPARRGFLRRLIRRCFAIVVSLLLLTLISTVTLVLAAAAFLICPPEFHIEADQVRWAIGEIRAKGYWPQGLDIAFTDLDLRIQRPGSLSRPEALQKRVALTIKNLHVQYFEAANVQFSDVNLAATAGWRGPGAGWGLLGIEPLRLLNGNVAIDVPRFPPSAKPEKPSHFSPIDFLTREVLPRWHFQGSQVSLDRMELRLAPDSAFRAQLNLLSLNDELLVKLTELAALNSPLRASGTIHVQPGDRGPISLDGEVNATWKITSDAQVRIDRKKQMDAHAGIALLSSHEARFAVETNFLGLPGVKSASLRGSLKKSQLAGKFSLKIGKLGEQLRALDLVNCAVAADLDKKTGGLDCGPETLRLKIVERSFIRDPKLYTLAPVLDLQVTHLDFGETKKADVALHVKLEHEGILHATTDVTGHYIGAPKQPAHYALEGSLDFAVAHFAKVVRLLHETVLSIPAPLNSLDGRIGVKAHAALNSSGGSVTYEARTLLDSPQQSVHLRFNGVTSLRKGEKGLIPKTDATLGIEALHLSAPRFDLRAPPRFIPDSRFGPLREMARDELDRTSRHEKIVTGPVSDEIVRAPKMVASPPMDFKLRMMTVEPEAIQIATNLTKTAIPAELNLLYDGSAAKPAPPKKTDEDRGLKSEIANGTRTEAARETVSGATSSASSAAVAARAPVTGFIVVGRTPVDLFRRNAVVKDVRLDLLPSGDNRISGDVNVTYLEYSIDILIAGLLNNPQIRFTSDPPLDDNQILSVLLFGRPLNELEDDQKSSVGNLNAAFADAALGISSLYLLASTPIESIGYDPERDLVLARLGLGGGTTLELGGSSDSSAIGVKKRLSHNFTFQSDVETLGASGKRTVSALVEWVRRF